MSLIDSMMEKCVLVEKTRESDGEGGFITNWQDGAEFDAAIVADTSTLAKIAEKQGVTSTYTVTTNKNVVLKYPDVIKRLSDGQIFRITSDGNDKKAPNISTIAISQATAERWVLTS